LIERGASLSSSHNESPLCSAISHDRYENAKLLLESGATVDEKTLEKPSSLEMIKLLLSYATNTTIANSRPLNAASRFGRLYIIPFLLEKNFALNAIDEFGQTPLLAACQANKPSLAVVEMLLSHGADVMTRSTSSYRGDISIGDTPCKSFLQ
jgi:ankyrin repeat protein